MTNTEEEIHIVGQDIKIEVNHLKDQTGKDIWLFGGAELITTFINYGLVDELQLAVHPLLLGQGKPIFNDIKGQINLTLANTKTYSSGLVQLFYEFTRK